jgi:hypothetical protein
VSFVNPNPSESRLCTETACESNVRFLQNLERWIDSIIQCGWEEGRSKEYATDRVIDGFVSALRSNSEFHMIMANLESGKDENNSPAKLRHLVMAEIYNRLIPK